MAQQFMEGSIRMPRGLPLPFAACNSGFTYTGKARTMEKTSIWILSSSRQIFQLVRHHGSSVSHQSTHIVTPLVYIPNYHVCVCIVVNIFRCLTRVLRRIYEKRLRSKPMLRAVSVLRLYVLYSCFVSIEYKES